MTIIVFCRKKIPLFIGRFELIIMGATVDRLQAIDISGIFLMWSSKS